MIGRTMWFRHVARMPLRLPLLFALLTLVPAVALGWLTFELLRTHQELERKRLRERAQAVTHRAADRILADSHQRLIDLERLIESSVDLPAGVVRIDVVEERITARHPAGLAYYPDVPAIEPLSSAYAAGER